MSTNEGMKDLIGVINRLHEVFTTTGQNLGLELPQIAVVGGQSAGKSSVLENFVGKDFLPRGSGIVTRRPLVLQLYHNKDSEWAEFLHTGNKKFTDFNQVRQEIEDETDRETGGNKGISKRPIHLRVYSPNVLDLTLIDLPGMTKVPVGDQPDNIEFLIREMIEDYINQESTIILAVSPANQDLANSDALKLARRADPEGLRTIGVITKLDLMDEGTDAREIFEGKILPLKKGYIGIVNRSQKDIDDKKGLVEAMQKERSFFSNSPYKNIMDRMGTVFLQQKLNDELGKHIKDKLPGIKGSLQKKIQDINSSLKELGYFNEEERNVIKLLYRLLAKFSDEVHTSLEGNSLTVSGVNLKGGALIHKTIYTEVFSLLKETIKEPNDYTVSMLLANLGGYRTSMFTHQLSLDIIIKYMVDTYKNPIKRGISIVKEVLSQCIHECCIGQLDAYSSLKQSVLYLMDSEIIRNEENTVTLLCNYLDAQMAYVNVKHPDFRAQRYKAEPQFSSMPNMDNTDTNSNSSENVENEELCRGQATLLTTGFRNDKEMFVVLYGSKIVIFKDETHFNKNKDTLSLNLSQLQCEPYPSPRGQLFVLSRTDGRTLYKNEKKLELLVQNDKSETWSDAFKDVGIYQELRGSTVSLNKTQNEEKSKGWMGLLGKKQKQKQKNVENEVREDPVNQEQTSVICKMAQAYMKIVNTSVYDMVPKYIILGLVQATERYAREDLVGDLLKNRETDDKKAELMETGNEDKRRINELLSTKSATEQALKVLSDM